ncbi:nucleotide exchange factor GrpE [Candidatus Dependentiae bacterium]|nr:nucleotide exchange factor GrpE [Candidatus Dependentiae bacterium]
MNFEHEELDNLPENQDQENNASGVEHGNNKNEIDMCLTELSLWKDQCKRISADFENFKKRTEREQGRWADVAKESILYDLLSFVDAFEVARTQPNIDKVALDMLYQSVLKILAKNDVKAMTEIKEFNPEFHEAVMQVESQDHSSGEIVQFLSKGFMLKDKVLRPAKVSVAL